MNELDKICNYCNSKSPEDSKFCVNCGEKFSNQNIFKSFYLKIIQLRKRFIMAFISILLLFFIAAKNISLTPEYSLYKLYFAAKTKNADEFMEYLDFEQIVDSYIENDSKKYLQEHQVNNHWEGLGIAFAEGLIKMMKPQIIERYKADLKSSIDDPSFNFVNNDFKMIYFLIFKNYKEISMNIDFINKDLCEINLNLYPYNQTYYKIKMHKMKDKWIIIEIFQEK
ncbi:MAG: hypothetical protein MZU84_03825 [Sphingobacterium sp.]|nr:hypothetical protein [Sphingobacterium sp.]